MNIFSSFNLFKSCYEPEEWEEMERGKKALVISEEMYKRSYIIRLITKENRETGKKYATKTIKGELNIYRKV